MTIRSLLYGVSYLPHFLGIICKSINYPFNFYFIDAASFVMLLICCFSEISLNHNRNHNFDYTGLLALNVLYSVLLGFCYKLTGVPFLLLSVLLTMLVLAIGYRWILKINKNSNTAVGNITYLNGAHILCYIIGYICIALLAGFINDHVLKMCICECVVGTMILQDWIYHTKLKNIIIYNYKTYIAIDTMLIILLTAISINVPELAICHFVAILHPVIITKVVVKCD